MYEYKILTERDARFTGSFDLAALEEALNEHGAQGWRLTESFVAANLWKSVKAEVILVLERPLQPVAVAAATPGSPENASQSRA